MATRSRSSRVWSATGATARRCSSTTTATACRGFPTTEVILPQERGPEEICTSSPWCYNYQGGSPNHSGFWKFSHRSPASRCCNMTLTRCRFALDHLGRFTPDAIDPGELTREKRAPIEQLVGLAACFVH